MLKLPYPPGRSGGSGCGGEASGRAWRPARGRGRQRRSRHAAPPPGAVRCCLLLHARVACGE
eukprot:92542-Alexandrium_andersonii.AAC.1